MSNTLEFLIQRLEGRSATEFQILRLTWKADEWILAVKLIMDCKNEEACMAGKPSQSLTTHIRAFRSKVGDYETAEAKRSVENLQDVQTSNVSRMPPVPNHGGVHEPLANGLVDVDAELSSLEGVADYSREFDIPSSDVRPCIAFMYYQGVFSERNPTAFAIARELFCQGVSEPRVLDAIVKFNTRLARPLPLSELEGILRRAASPRYDKPHGCKHPLLAAFCIGMACPWQSIRSKGTKRPIVSELIASPWLCILNPYSFVIVLGLHRLRMLRGYPVDAKLIFNYRQLEQITGIKRSSLTRHLKGLEEYGLITDLEIGDGWGSGKRGAGTSLRFVWPIPTNSFRRKGPPG